MDTIDALDVVIEYLPLNASHDETRAAIARLREYLESHDALSAYLNRGKS